jgi:hypothetical protein
MIFAWTPGSGGETDWRFQIALVSPAGYYANLAYGVLRLECPCGAVDQWEKWFP